MITILHVEDDPLLAELVQHTFEAFGFRGKSLIAGTVAHAREILTDLTGHPRLELVITDMNLPDGCGLDVVRTLRANPVRAHVPILVLSGELDRARVDRAYALGANSYVSKGSGARSMRDVLRSLYDHWLRDVALPTTRSGHRTQDVIASGMCLRMREADLFARISAAVDDPEQAAFWLSMALRQGNWANVLTFIDQQLRGRELDKGLLDEILAHQQREQVVVARCERELDQRPQDTAAIARHALLALTTQFPSDDFARLIGQLFPLAPAPVGAMRELVTRGIEEIIAWLEHGERDASVDANIRSLRAKVLELRAWSSERVASHA